MRLISVAVLLFLACADDAASDARVDAGLVSGCRVCERTADCSGYQCVDGLCFKPCQSHGDCFPRGSAILECTTFPEDAGMYCVGGPEGCP